jgi:hypothetical protein
MTSITYLETRNEQILHDHGSVNQQQCAGFAEREGKHCALDLWPLLEEDGVAASGDAVGDLGGERDVVPGSRQAGEDEREKAYGGHLIVPAVAAPWDVSIRTRKE